MLLSPRPGKVWKIIEPPLSRELSPDQIRREPGYLDTVESIWQNLKDYVEYVMELFGYRIPTFASLLLWALVWEIVGRAGVTILLPPLSA